MEDAATIVENPEDGMADRLETVSIDGRANDDANTDGDGIKVERVEDSMTDVNEGPALEADAGVDDDGRAELDGV